MSDQVVMEDNEKKQDSDIGGKDSRPKTGVSKERIERLKRAFRPTWLLEQLNGAEKNGTRKK